MGSTKKIITAVLIFAVFMLAMHLIGRYLKPDDIQNEEEVFFSSNHVAPDFTVYDWDGNDVRLADGYPDPIVIFFWASWDDTSRELLPEFEQMYQKYGEKIAFMMVNITDGNKETKAGAKAFLKEEGYTFPVYFDTEGDAAAAYGTRSIPATFFVNSKFELIARASGPITSESLEKGMKMAMEPEGNTETE